MNQTPRTRVKQIHEQDLKYATLWMRNCERDELIGKSLMNDSYRTSTVFGAFLKSGCI